MQTNTQLTLKQVEEFIYRHRLPDRFRNIIDEHYSRLTEWLVHKRQPGNTFLLGINGAQGTGKSTLADYLQLVLHVGYQWQVSVLSIDDFYLTKAERKQLGKQVHPLLETRGVPGTHNVSMLTDCITELRNLNATETVLLPRFDKALDDRINSDCWPIVTGPIDLIILEGWCVGSTPQADDALSQPINFLEQQKDASGDWRRYVNKQLEGLYAELFAQLDALVFLQAPNFDAIYRWRQEQEEKLAASTPHKVTEIMGSNQIALFIQHYERLTKANLAALPVTADVILELDDNHDYVRSCYALQEASSRVAD